MAWYWILLIVFFALGAPWGWNFAFTTPDAFYHHPVLDGFDILGLLFLYVLQLLAYGLFGWGFAIYYGVQALRTA